MNDYHTRQLREKCGPYREQFEKANSLETKAMAALRMLQSNWLEHLTYYTSEFKHEDHGTRLNNIIVGVIEPLIKPLSIDDLGDFIDGPGFKGIHNSGLRAHRLWPSRVDAEIPGMDASFVEELCAASERLVDNEKRIVGMINPLLGAKGIEAMEKARISTHGVGEKMKESVPLQLIRVTDPEDIEIFLQAYDFVAGSLKELKVSDELNSHLDAIKAYALEMIARAREEKPPRPTGGWTPVFVKT